MENASKALLIAGGFLIGILLASFMMFLFKSLSASSSDLYESMTGSQITEHNQKFLAFELKDGSQIFNNDGTPKTDKNGNNMYNVLTQQELVTLINIAKDHNNNPKVPTTVEIYLNDGGTSSSIIDNSAYNTLTTENFEHEYIFRGVEFNHNLVSKIYIEKVDI